jgi:uncharacterized membrane protein YdcZ (DUF606 family)
VTICSRLVTTILVCSVVSASVGCTSMRTIRPIVPGGQETTFRDLKAGDTVWLRTTTGRTARFVIQQVEADTIIAPDGVRYARADIVELKRRSFSAARTAGLAGGIFGGLFILVAAAAAAALGGLMGSGG